MRPTDLSPVSVRAGRAARARPGSAGGRVAWAVLLAATLVLKAFVPLLAAASAQLQGVAVADVCAVYGVRLAAPAVSLAHHHHPEHGAAHVAVMPMDEAGIAGSTSHPAPGDDAGHARDHCALTGLAFCALAALAPWGVADWGDASVRPPRSGVDAAPARDASARWLALRVHAPPAAA